MALTAEIVSAYLGCNHVRPADLPSLIQSVHATLAGLASGGSDAPPAVAKATAAEIKRSITSDYLVSFEDGKHYKTLARHLRLRSLSPEAYRAKWGLPADYPMTAANYSAQRAALARRAGLGRAGSARQTAPAAEQDAAEDAAQQMVAGQPSAEQFEEAITREPFDDGDFAE
ncbi:MucR family transcriptional regulator [Methylobacterium oxalidis]|uniref:MucR family transcriptional regulator n=1 Tax=Methylobacterium oxalidis TaxID=944322 RepID=UPI0027952E90|nr:MucR family transcriptional regulator [Methylobacterium oxalidis]